MTLVPLKGFLWTSIGKLTTISRLELLTDCLFYFLFVYKSSPPELDPVNLVPEFHHVNLVVAGRSAYVKSRWLAALLMWNV